MVKMEKLKKNRYFSKAPKSLSEATKPILFVSRILGMSPKNRLCGIWTILIMIFHFAMNGWVMWILDGDRKSAVTTFVRDLHHLWNIVTIWAILGSSLIQPKRFLFPLREITAVDKSLRSLGVQMNEDWIYKMGYLQIACAILLPSAFIFSDVYDVATGRKWSYLGVAWFLYVTTTISSIIADCLFVDYLFILRDRFRKINSLLEHYVKGEASSRGRFFEIQSTNEVNEITRMIRLLKREHHALFIISVKVNEAFGLHLLVGVAASSILIISELYQTYYSLVFDQSSLYEVLYQRLDWIVIHGGRLLLLSQACSSTSDEANRTPFLLHEMPTTIGNVLLRGEIRDFSMQLIHESLRFTACGFFTYDFTLISGLIGSICTYLVILVQMVDGCD